MLEYCGLLYEEDSDKMVELRALWIKGPHNALQCFLLSYNRKY